MPSGVSLYSEVEEPVPRRQDLTRLARSVLRGEKLRGRVNIVFCSDSRVRYLNHKYRGLDRVTDVLSFSWDEPDFAGEIFIAAPQARRQCKRYKNSYFNELRRLIVHGLLHLCGYDHMRTRDREIMRKKEISYLSPQES